MTWLWWAPLGAACLHILEEFVCPGGFAAWDREYRPAIRASITTRLHVVVNLALLLACVQVGLLSRTDEPAGRVIGVLGWLALSALLFTNALYHVLGSVRTKRYSPGVVTGVVLYLPLAVVGYGYFVGHGEASVDAAAVAAVVGGSYHLWAAVLHRLRAGDDRRTAPPGDR